VTRLLIVGGGGMLGYTLLRRLAREDRFDVHATVRQPVAGPVPDGVTLHSGIDVTTPGSVEATVDQVRPDEVLNCAGVIKQLDQGQAPIASIAVNALLPHRLAAAATAVDARLIQFSTDCVFDGARGGYAEDDAPNATDLYGRSKTLGEVGYGRHLTLRTSLIGHELRPGVSLVDWFLRQQGEVNGYTRAVFSGFPTVEIARILADYILPRRELSGILHLAARPIDKFALLGKVAAAYGHEVTIVPTDRPRIDRSLDGRRLAGLISYAAPEWDDLVAAMHRDFVEAYAPLRGQA